VACRTFVTSSPRLSTNGSPSPSDGAVGSPVGVTDEDLADFKWVLTTVELVVRL
jgi:hypothetical protein